MTDPAPLYSPRRLDVTTVERALRAWEAGFPRPIVDLSRITRLDPFGLLLLVLLGRRCREAGGRLRVLLPEGARARERLVGSGLFHHLEGAYWTDKPLPEALADSELSPVRVRDEAEIRAVVDAVGERLAARFPFGEKGNRLLIGALIELLQNIVHHADPDGAGPDPFGLAALEEEREGLHLAIADKGVGLAASLGLNPRYRGLSAPQALEAVLVDGASRFEDPGRGGALRGIREAVVASSGRFYLRSGGGAFLQEDVEWSVGEVLPFPGVQISIVLPRILFERGEES